MIKFDLFFQFAYTCNSPASPLYDYWNKVTSTSWILSMLRFGILPFQVLKVSEHGEPVPSAEISLLWKELMCKVSVSWGLVGMCTLVVQELLHTWTVLFTPRTTTVYHPCPRRDYPVSMLLSQKFRKSVKVHVCCCPVVTFKHNSLCSISITLQEQGLGSPILKFHCV